MCKYVCLHVYVYMCVYVCKSTPCTKGLTSNRQFVAHLGMYTHVCMCLRMYTCVYVCIYLCVYGMLHTHKGPNK